MKIELLNEPLFILAVVVPSFFFGAVGGFAVVFVAVVLVEILPLATVLLCDAGTGATLLLWVSS